MKRVALVVAAALALCGCYRVAAPASTGETVRVEVLSNDARLVRGQASVHAAVAEALTNRLGWNVRPDGSARLELTLAREDQTSTANDRTGIPARWSITLSGTARLRTRHGEIARAWNGVGHASGLESEAAALDQAAANGAAEIAAWLQAATAEMGQHQKPAP